MKLNKITKSVTPVLVKTGGAIAEGYAAKYIPFGNDKVKHGILGVVGLVLASSSKGTMAQLGEGMAIGAAVKVANSLGIGSADYITGDDDGVEGIEDTGL